MVIIIYGALLQCVEIVMLYHRLTSQELRREMEDAEVQAMLYEDSFEQKIAGTMEQFYAFSTISAKKPTPFTIDHEWQDDKTVTNMYTSGTTGYPKGVRQTAQNYTSNAMSSVLNLGLMEDDCWLCTMPLFHISGFSILICTLLYGMKIILYE